MPEKTNDSQNSSKKSRLGRGLGSLLPSDPSGFDGAAGRAPSGANASTESQRNSSHPQVKGGASATAEVVSEEARIWKISIDRLKPNVRQPRQVFTREALQELTDSIKEKGILQPIVARRLSEREFEIIAGERRWRAAQAAGLHEVPVILKKVGDQDSLELAIIENIQRENLNPIEEAIAYQRLMTEYALTQQQIADKLGKERSSVANMLRLLGLPGEVKDLISKNEISTGHAKVLLGLDDQKTLIAIARRLAKEKISVRGAEKLVAKARLTKSEGNSTKGELLSAQATKRRVEALAGDLQKLLGTKVHLEYISGKGRIDIHFYSDDQFNQIIEKLRASWKK